MKKILKDYFSFNSRERVAIILLCCLMAFFWLLPNWYPEKKSLPEAIQLNAMKADTTQEVRNRILRKPIAIKQINALKLFVFDPNELSEDGWRKLGLSEKIVQIILNYRSKGGRFRAPSDIKKIWGLSSQEANKLIPFISITKLEKPVIQHEQKTKKVLQHSILINQATAMELESLPGISKSLAARMIKFRDKLGGFRNMEQVRKTYGLNDSIFVLIEPFIVLD